MIDALLSEANAKMDQAVEHTAQEFGGIRTGRANAGILSRITVDYYGTETPLQQLEALRRLEGAVVEEDGTAAAPRAE